MCSSAGVTRPSWSEEKKLRYPGAADIPIVRLNPVNILNIKKDGMFSRANVLAYLHVLIDSSLNEDLSWLLVGMLYSSFIFNSI
jgi:hypothetical protein